MPQLKGFTADFSKGNMVSDYWFFCLDARPHKLLELRRVSGLVTAVSCLLLTSEARDLSQVKSCGICGGQSVTGDGFLRVLRFPLPILIPPTTSYPCIVRG
jgi:hypothetical protein